MPKLPQIKPRTLERILIKKGFSPRPTKGGHIVFVHPDGRRTVIPGHNEPVRTGTLRAIMDQTKLTLNDIIKKK